jgi:hypothetical protein
MLCMYYYRKFCLYGQLLAVNYNSDPSGLVAMATVDSDVS